MKKHNTTSKRSSPSRVLGSRVFAAISAVEGLKLTSEGRQRVEVEAPLERRRADVLRAYMEPKKHK